MPDPTSFTARRSAASNLPSFHLPPPELSQKFPPFAPVNLAQPTPPSSVLTPPSNIPGDILSPVSSGVASGSSGTSNGGIPPYTPVGFWPPPVQSGSPYGFSGGPGHQSMMAAQNANFSSKSMFSPSLFSLGRNISNSPGAGEGSLPPPPYELNLPPFPTSMPMSATGAGLSSSLPNASVQQHVMANALMGSQTPVSAASTHPAPTHAPEHHFQQQKPPPTPNYYGNSHPASAPPHQTQFPNSFSGPSPHQQSPNSAGAHARISPLSGNPSQPPALHPAPPPPASHFARPVSYSLPAMSGPIMSNIHNPGSQMSLVGGLSGGLVSAYPNNNMSHLYGGSPHTPQQQQNDRPFKCDQCPQSFNRNHDLKRHKRIHLAVKPFPCGHCDKSFSRKDALKRHILVKGCGNAKSADSSDSKADGSLSPPDKGEILSSDGADDSPVLSGAEAIKGEL
ncbi:MAG: hypothetical protein M1833_006226 [Piccolia ochrophora]|nr:MAG: hypothetical protein M1833_006226 [Piccolia ochrophora]